jgi:hypothetical protein
MMAFHFLRSVVAISFNVSVVGDKRMKDVAESLGRRLELPFNYPVVGWKELVNIQAPKDRAWARDERVLDLLTKCLEVKHNCAYLCTSKPPKLICMDTD